MNDPALQSVAPAHVAPTNPLGQALLALNNSHAAEIGIAARDKFDELLAAAAKLGP